MPFESATMPHTSPHDHDHEGHDHHHGHNHAHGHGHAHAPANFDRAFAIGITVNFAFVLIETVCGIAADSIALVADAGHNLADVLGLLLAWGAARLAKRLPNARRTYGFGRSSILASLGNAVLLFIGIGGIAVEALRRLFEPAPVATGIVMGVAALGILINGGTALLFMRGRHNDLNIRGAFLHMAADALVSLGVVLTSLVISVTGLQVLDPVVGLFIAIFIAFSTWNLLRESLHLALDGVPDAIDPGAVHAYLGQLPGVTEVHDLHIWAMSTTETALTAHIVRPGTALDDALLQDVSVTLKRRFRIHHATVQVEHGDGDCALAPAEVV